MAHLATCRTYRELTGNIWVTYSDQNCQDHSHNEDLRSNQ